MKENIIIPSVLISLLCIFGYLYYQESEKIRLERLTKKETIGISDLDLLKDGKTIIWAGYYGEHPRFIAKGPMRGLGWAEYPVFTVKKTLEQDYGIRLLSTYMTPSRMELDFNTNDQRRPMCSYPYMFKDPKKEFSKKVKFLYSYPVEFSGEKKSKIIFPKESRHKFTKYLNENGDLMIESLIKDSSLKTTIIKDKDLGNIMSSFMEKDIHGQQQIKKKYKKNIKMIVASDNMQLLKMMKGERFDYSFESYFTAGHFAKAMFDKNEFDTLTYENETIKDSNDEKLVFSVVRCTDHPLNHKLMPIINKAIADIIGPSSEYAFHKYREQIDEGYQSNFKSQTETLIFRIFSSNYYWWYDKYLKTQIKTNDEKKKKIYNIPINLANEKIKPKQIGLNHSIYFKNNRLVVLESQESYLEDDKDLAKYRIGESHDTINKNNIIFHLNQLDLDIINKKNKIDNINQDILSRVEFLTICASNMTNEKIVSFVKSIPNLKGIIYLFPSKQAPNKFLEILPDNLEEFAMVRSTIDNQSIQHILKLKKLKYLDLSGSFINSTFLLQILKMNQTSLVTLKLAYLKLSIDENFTKDFSKIFFPKLTYLDLANNNLAAPITSNLVHSIKKMSNIEYLNLEENQLYSSGLEDIFNNNIRIKTFIASNVLFLNNSEEVKITPPEGMENILLKNSNLDDYSIKNFTFNTKLMKLDISYNEIKDQGLLDLVDKLPPSVQSINFSNSKNSSYKIKEILKKLAKFELKNLAFNYAQIKDNDIIPILKKNKKIETLELKGNLISNQTFLQINNLPSLKKLDLRNNFLSKPNISNLTLQELYLAENFITSTKTLYEKSGPLQLRILDLQFNRIPSIEIILKMKEFSNLTQISFGTRDQEWTKEDSINFSKINNGKITHFTLQSAINGLDTTLNLIQSLPDSLRLLSLKGNLSYETFESNTKKAQFNYPLGLDYIMQFKIPTHDDIFPFILPHDVNSVSLLFPKDSKSINSMLLNTKKNYNLYVGSRSRFGAMTNIQGDFLNGYFPEITPNAFINGLISNRNMVYLSVGLSKNFKDASETDIPLSTFTHKVKSNLQFLKLSGVLLDDNLLDTIIQRIDLSRLINLNIGSTSLTHKGIISFIKASSVYLSHLGIQSTQLDANGVDELIRNLPPHLIELQITGNKIGELGLMKFRKWQQEQSSKLGLLVKLID